MAIMSRGNSQQPAMPTSPPRPQATQRPIAPAVQEHIAWTQSLVEENERLKESLQRAVSDLELARDRSQQLEFMLQDERQRFLENDRMKEKYLRFAQAILTGGEGFSSMLDHLREEHNKLMARAMEIAQKHEPAPPALPQVEDEIKKALDVMKADASATTS